VAKTVRKVEPIMLNSFNFYTFSCPTTLPRGCIMEAAFVISDNTRQEVIYSVETTFFGQH